MTGPSNGADRRETAVPDSSAQRSRPTPLGSRYLLEYPIGQGASGRVWHGRRRRDGAPVAIKVLREEYAADPDVIARFLRERSALQALDHPNLVRIDDLVVEGDTLAVVMELVDGQDLRWVFQRGSLDIRQVHVLLAQVADALAHIHDEGVLHRDIKPENILIAQHDGELTARLTDFGLAWVADGQQLTRSTHMVGTPAYVAPELLAGRPYGSAVDVYALGVTAYELLAGRRPFTADHPMALMRAHLDEEPQRPPGMSTGQWDIVSACLSKSPEERPTAAQLATWWGNLRDGLPLKPASGTPATSDSPARAMPSNSSPRARAMSPSRARLIDTSHAPAQDRRPGKRGPARRGLLTRLPRWQISVAAILLLLAAATVTVSTLRRPSAAASGVTACGYKIGFLGYLPGTKIPGFSAIAFMGTKIAVDRYNATHPDCAVELVEYNTYKQSSTDDNNDDTLAGQQAGAIAADDKVLGVVGPTWSGEVNPSMPVLDRAGVPAISPMLTASNLSQRGWGVFHRTLGNHHDESAAAVRHLTRTLKATRVLIMIDDSDNADKLNRIEDGAEVQRLLGGACIGSTSISEATYATQIGQIKATRADSVYYLGGQILAGDLLKQLRAARINIPVLGSSRNFGSGLIDAAGPAAEGFRMTNSVAPSEALPKNLKNDLRTTLTQAGTQSVEGYDAATVLLSGLAAGNRSREAMLAWVNSYDRDGLVHHIKFTAKGDLDPAVAKVWIWRYTNGAATLDSVTAA